MKPHWFILRVLHPNAEYKAQMYYLAKSDIVQYRVYRSRAIGFSCHSLYNVAFEFIFHRIDLMVTDLWSRSKTKTECVVKLHTNRLVCDEDTKLNQKVGNLQLWQDSPPLLYAQMCCWVIINFGVTHHCSSVLSLYQPLWPAVDILYQTSAFPQQRSSR